MMQGSASPFDLPSGQPQAGVEEKSPGLSHVLSVRFNQDYSSFVCGTESGFVFIDCNSLKSTCRDSTGNGFAIVEMLLNTGIFALVGGGKNPCYSTKSVVLYNDYLNRPIWQLDFRSPVRAVRLHHDFIVVVLEFEVFAYSNENLEKPIIFMSMSNIKGVCALSSTGVLVCPGQERTGHVRIVRIRARPPPLCVRTSFEFQAHETSLACLALTLDGSLVATASTEGTLVNIFSTNDGTKLQELRRGADQADIFSMAFSANSQLLVLSSSKGTVHMFRIKANKIEEPRRTEKSTMLASLGNARSISQAGSILLSSAAATAGSSYTFVKGYMPKYLVSDLSLCQFRLPGGSRGTVAFGPKKDTIIIVCTDGSLYECSFDPVNGGLCHLRNYVFMAWCGGEATGISSPTLSAVRERSMYTRLHNFLWTPGALR